MRPLDGYEVDWSLSAGRKPFAFAGAPIRYPRDRYFDMEHVRLELEPDFGLKRISGVCTLSFRALSDGIRTLTLDCAELVVNRVRDQAGSQMQFEQYGNKLNVFLKSPSASGQEFKIQIDYEGSPRRGLYFISPDEAYPKKPLQLWTQGEDEDSRFWFPCYDYPNDRATSELIVTVPRNMIAISNGKLVNVSENPSARTKTFHWFQQIPHVSYLVSLVAGEFAEAGETYDGIDLKYYVPLGREADAKRSFNKTRDMVQFFSERTGVKYPYPKYAQVTVSDFIYGGMENTSATTLTEETLHDERAHIDFSSDPLVAHELAHQWFGDLLTCKDWSHAWLNEGFATYFEALYREHDLGADEFQYRLYEQAEAYFKEDKERYRRAIVTKVYYDPSELFDRHLYQKGGLVLHMLRGLIGDDKFWNSIKRYTRKFREQVVDTDDFRRAIEEETGLSLEWFFDQWVYKPGHPELRVGFEWKAENSLVQLTVEQTQDTSDGTPIFRIPCDVVIVNATAESRHRILIDAKTQTFTFPSFDKPLSVSLDPDAWVLGSQKFEKPFEILSYELLHGKIAMTRIRATQELASQVSGKTVELLREAFLTEKFWGVQAQIAETLGKIGTELALKVLIECISVKHPKARRAVVSALGEFKQETAVEALLRTLEKDESYLVEAAAAKSLGKTKSPKVTAALERALRTKDSFNEVIRVGALEGFEELRHESAIEIGKEFAAYGKPMRVREAAVKLLGKVGAGKPDALGLLVDLSKDRSFHIKRATVEALGELGDPKAIPALERVVESEIDPRIKRRARESLRKLKEEREKTAEWQQMRDEVERLKEENRRLKERMEQLESKFSAASK